MSRSEILFLCALLAVPLLLLGYQKGAPTTRATVASAASTKADYDVAAGNMAKSVKYAGQPLRNLTKEQKGAVAALLVMSRIVGQNEGARSVSGLQLSNSFWTEVSGICPAPRQITFRRGRCLDEEGAYAEAVASCMADKQIKKTQEQCEKESGGKLSAAVMCRMKQIEELPRIIGGIPGRQWPPGPFPWPEVGRPPTP